MMTIGEFRIAVCEEMSRRGYDQYWEPDPARGTLLQGRPKDPKQRWGRLWSLWVLGRGKDKALLQSRVVGTNTAGDPVRPGEELRVTRDETGVAAACDLAVRWLDKP